MFNGSIYYVLYLQILHFSWGATLGKNSAFGQSWNSKLHISAPQCKNQSIYAFSGYMQATFFYLRKNLMKLADDQCFSITKGSIYHVKHNGHTNFLPWDGLTWNCTLNGSIYYVLYLHILHFYFVRQICNRILYQLHALRGIEGLTLKQYYKICS